MPAPSQNFHLHDEFHDGYHCSRYITSLSLVSRRYFFYPAQFWPHKNHLVILLALFNLVLKQDSVLADNLKIVFCGSDRGNLRSIKQYATELGIADRVLFLDFVSTDKLNFLYSSCLALIYPSFFGPDNLPPLEAMMHKTTVLAADVPGVREQLHRHAKYFNPNDYVQLSALMKELIIGIGHDPVSIESSHAYALKRTPANYIAVFEKYILSKRLLLKQVSNAQ